MVARFTGESAFTLATPFASSTPKLACARTWSATRPKLLQEIRTSAQSVTASTNAIGASAKA
jgi:hypothetical protein